MLYRLFLNHSEKHLLKYRQQAEGVRNERWRDYSQYLPLLEKCYEQAVYWHGTGHYHYRHPNDTRYGAVEHIDIVNVLESILSNRGLNGHQDLWVQINSHFKKTVSVAPSRMHARLYAHIHLYKGVWLDYVFGGTRFWMGFFFFLATRALLVQPGPGGREFLKQTVLNRNFLKRARIWANAICNMDAYKVIPWWRAYDLRSDIEGNHPVLIGLTKDAVSGDGVVPFLRQFEVRVAKRIPLHCFYSC